MRRTAPILALLAAIAAATTVSPALATPQPPQKPQPTTYSDSGPEPQLARILAAIEQNKLDSALQQTEALLKQGILEPA